MQSFSPSGTLQRGDNTCNYTPGDCPDVCACSRTYDFAYSNIYNGAGNPTAEWDLQIGSDTVRYIRLQLR
jgi:hypothetical protein